MSRLIDEIESLHRCITLADLKREYGTACHMFAGDPAAMWAVREATFYAKERLLANLQEINDD